MRSLTLRVTVALLSFGIGLATASVWFTTRVKPEFPTCYSFAGIYAHISNEIPSATLCEIVNDPERYRDRVVRLSASFHSDSGAISLKDATGNCAKSTYTHAGFSGLTVSCDSCQDGNLKLLSIHSGYNTWYDGPPVDVVVVGRFGVIDDKNFYSGREGFNILCLEQVKPTGTGIWQRIYYTLGRAANFVVPPKS